MSIEASSCFLLACVLCVHLIFFFGEWLILLSCIFFTLRAGMNGEYMRFGGGETVHKVRCMAFCTTLFSFW